MSQKEPRVSDYAISYNQYGRYCVPKSSSHRPAALKILEHDVYEPQTIGFMMSYCGEGDIVHAGAYFGDFLPALSRAVVGGAKVWAFEPNPENYLCAQMTLKMNDIQNVVLTHAALGEKKGSLPMQIVDENGHALGGASRIVSQGLDTALESCCVDVVSLDSVIEDGRQVSILQLDVEGYEKEALLGAMNIIGRCLPIIILEVWPNSTLLNSVWFEAAILALGYKKVGAVHQNVIFSVGHLKI